MNRETINPSKTFEISFFQGLAILVTCMFLLSIASIFSSEVISSFVAVSVIMPLYGGFFLFSISISMQ